MLKLRKERGPRQTAWGVVARRWCAPWYEDDTCVTSWPMGQLDFAAKNQPLLSPWAPLGAM